MEVTVICSNSVKETVRKWFIEHMSDVKVEFRAGKKGTVKVITDKHHAVFNSLRKVLLKKGVNLSVWTVKEKSKEAI